MTTFRRAASTACTAFMLAGLALCGLALAPAAAQAPASYPSQTIRLVVPYAAGGLPDTVARIVGKRLQERLGQNVVTENRAGGAGALGASALTGSPADGYTLMVSDGAIISV